MRGFIYVLSNPELSGLLKIGKTSEDPKNRSDDLYSTGLPAPFKLEYMAFCDDMDALELRVHEKLAGHRPNLDREFFKISRLSAVNTIRNESKQFGGLLFEEKNFTNAEEFWQLAQRLHQQNSENKDKGTPIYNKESLAVQKPSSKEVIVIVPPKSRPVNFGQDYEDYARFENDVIWSVYQTSPAGEAKPRVMRLTEQSFEEEINNNFARAFPYNPQGQWVLGSTNEILPNEMFRPHDSNEPYWNSEEDEIITWSEYHDRIKNKNTKVEMNQNKQNDAKQKRHDDMQNWEEQRQRRGREIDKIIRRKHEIWMWVIIFSAVMLVMHWIKN